MHKYCGTSHHVIDSSRPQKKNRSTLTNMPFSQKLREALKVRTDTTYSHHGRPDPLD